MSGAFTTADRIRDAGLRVTQARIAVLDTLARLGGHRTADDLIRDLERRGVAVARASVFNVLDDLTEAGIATIAEAGPGVTYYEMTAAAHDHLVCRVCGGIFDVPRPDVGAPPLDAGIGTADDATVVYRGTCVACSGELGGSSRSTIR